MIAEMKKGEAQEPCVSIRVSVRRKCAPVFLTLFVAMLAPEVCAEPEASWLTPTDLSSHDGLATLRWSVSGDDPVALFKITAEHEGARQVSYTDQPQLQLMLPERGKYTFLVHACTRMPDGYPQCGVASQPLVLTVATGQDASCVADSGQMVFQGCGG